MNVPTSCSNSVVIHVCQFTMAILSRNLGPASSKCMPVLDTGMARMVRYRLHTME